MRQDLHQPVWRPLFLTIFFMAISMAFGDRVSASAFVVNSTTDSVDVNPGDGRCQTASGECSLRAAIQEANAIAGPDVIQLQAGTYVLGIAGTGEDSAASGDLDILDSVSIVGDSVSKAVVEASQIDRVFHVRGQASLSISGMTVRGGDAIAFFPLDSFLGEGGGFFVDAGAELALKDAMITGNRGGTEVAQLPTMGGLPWRRQRSRGTWVLSP